MSERWTICPECEARGRSPQTSGPHSWAYCEGEPIEVVPAAEADRLRDALREAAESLERADAETGFGDDFEAEVKGVVADMRAALGDTPDE